MLFQTEPDPFRIHEAADLQAAWAGHGAVHGTGVFLPEDRCADESRVRAAAGGAPDIFAAHHAALSDKKSLPGTKSHQVFGAGDITVVALQLQNIPVIDPDQPGAELSRPLQLLCRMCFYKRDETYLKCLLIEFFQTVFPQARINQENCRGAGFSCQDQIFLSPDEILAQNRDPDCAADLPQHLQGAVKIIRFCHDRQDTGAGSFQLFGQSRGIPAADQVPFLRGKAFDVRYNGKGSRCFSFFQCLEKIHVDILFLTRLMDRTVWFPDTAYRV